MKFTNIILIIVVLILTGFLISHRTTHTENKQTSAYQRVLNSGTLRCGYVNWAPYYIKDPNSGKVSGISYDIITEVGKILDLQINWAEEIGWGNIGEGFKTKRYDAVCTSMWPDAGKFKNMSLSIPLFYSTLYPYVRANDNRFDGHIERINQSDVKIAAIDGGMIYHLAQDSFPQAKIVAVPQLAQDAEYLMTVSTGKADVVIMDRDEIKKFMAANPDQLRAIKDVAPIRVLPHKFALPPDEPQLTAMINGALQLLIDNGYMAHIQEKYGTAYLLPTTGFQPVK